MAKRRRPQRNDIAGVGSGSGPYRDARRRGHGHLLIGTGGLIHTVIAQNLRDARADLKREAEGEQRDYNLYTPQELRVMRRVVKYLDYCERALLKVGRHMQRSGSGS